MQKYKLKKDILVGDCDIQLAPEIVAKYPVHRFSAIEGKKDIYKINGKTTFFINSEIGIDIENVKPEDRPFLDPMKIDIVAKIADAITSPAKEEKREKVK